jgi:hypothetical protein
MRMALAGHQFPRAFAVPFGTSAAQKGFFLSIEFFMLLGLK